MNFSPKHWALLRVAVVLIATWSISEINPAIANLDWIACFLISTTTGVAIFFWLYFYDRRQAIDKTSPFSLTRPFLPMNQYPIQYWMTTALVLIIGGGIALLTEIIAGGIYPAFCGTFIFLGIAILLAILGITGFKL